MIYHLLYHFAIENPSPPLLKLRDYPSLMEMSLLVVLHKPLSIFELHGSLTCLARMARFACPLVDKLVHLCNSKGWQSEFVLVGALDSLVHRVSLHGVPLL